MKQTFTTGQKNLLNNVENGTFRNVRDSFKLEYIKKDDKWFDYILLVTALRRHHKTIVNFLLKNDCRVRRRTLTDSFYTPLHYAVEIGDSDIVKKLLKKGASIHDKHFIDKTPLCLAAQEKRFDIVDLMLDNSSFAHVTTTSNDDVAHFQIACMRYRLKIVQRFLECGFPLNSVSVLDAECCRGFTPLHFALMNYNITGWIDSQRECDCINVVQLLVRQGADVSAIDNEGRTPLHCAIYRIPNLDVLVDLLLSRVPTDVNSTDSRGLSHFHIACTRNDLSIVQGFLHHGVSVDSCINSDEGIYSGYSALHLAVAYNRKDIVELLLQHHANVDIRAQTSQVTPLHLACMHSHGKFYEVIKAFTNIDKSIDWTSSRKNQIEIVKLLLNHKADVNSKNSDGETPLMYTCEGNINTILRNEVHPIIYSYNYHQINNHLTQELSSRQEEIVDVLLCSNANLHICNSSNASILHLIIAGSTSSELTISFLAKGINVHAVDNAGNTPLHIAARHLNLNIIKIFLNHNANVNAKTSEHMTPLHVAIKHITRTCLKDTNAIIEILIDNGSDVNAQTVTGETPLHMAFTNHEASVIEQLLQHGADINRGNAEDSPTIMCFYEWKVKYSNNGFYTETIEKVTELIEIHLKKLNTIGFYISEKVKKYYCKLKSTNDLDIVRDSDDVFVKCTREIEKMKNLKIDSYSTLYDILFKDQNAMAKHIKNASLKVILADDSFEDEFPLYGYMLKLQFRRGLVRGILLKPAIDSLKCITGSSLPDSCSESILQYFTNNDLEKLIKVDALVSKRKLDCIDVAKTEEPLEKQRRLE